MAQRKGGSQQSKAAKQIKKHVKRLPKALKTAIIVCLAIGICLGAAVCAYISREDGFYLNGEKEITLSAGASYAEQGATVVSLGKDLSEQIQISGTVDTVTAGVYYIVYTVDCYKYGDYQLVRKVTVTEGGGDTELGNTDNDNNIVIDGELSIHFLELGNNNSGDCIYIKAGENDILIDAGSRKNSADNITAYVNDYVTDGILEYVIVTHAHQDHIAAFVDSQSLNGIFTEYECGTIIDFPRTEVSSQLYGDYVDARDAEVAAGAVHYTALQCYNETDGAERVIRLTDEVEMEILYNYYYENDSSDENNYSVCLILTHGDRHFLFTGDLEGDGEEKLLEYNDLPEVELFKAGHHGSYSATTASLLAVIKPKIVCVTCVCGSVEYTQNFETTFPAQDVVNRIAQYTDKVYVTTQGLIEYDTQKEKYDDVGFTSMNGNIVVTSSAEGVTVNCSNNNTYLKDTDWFHEYRDTPLAWLL